MSSTLRLYQLQQECQVYVEGTAEECFDSASCSYFSLAYLSLTQRKLYLVVSFTLQVTPTVWNGLPYKSILNTEPHTQAHLE